MSTILQLLLYWLRYILSEIFRVFDKEVIEECAIGWCTYDEMINMDKRIEKDVCKEKNTIFANLLKCESEQSI